MARTVVMGDPACFEIRSGNNPHTRTRWGRKKRVDRVKAAAQWRELKSHLEAHGVRVLVIPPVEGVPGLVFPANAGFRFGKRVYLSNLTPGREAEREHDRRFLQAQGFAPEHFPSPHPFEGEADFIPVADPLSASGRRMYLFTYGRRIHPPRRGVLPFHWVYGFRSDRRALAALQRIAGAADILPLELIDPAHYHGDTVLCPFGPRGEFLLVFLEGLSRTSREALRGRFGERLVCLSAEDGRRFAANSFQVLVRRGEKIVPVLFMPDGLSQVLYAEVRRRGVIPCPVDVSEFFEKGGGAVKCMLLDLGDC